MAIEYRAFGALLAEILRLQNPNLSWYSNAVTIGRLAVLLCLLFVCAVTHLYAQTSCLTADEIKKLTAQVEAKTTRPFDQKLAEHLDKIAGKEQQRIENKVADNKSDETILKTLRAARAKHQRALLYS